MAKKAKTLEPNELSYIREREEIIASIMGGLKDAAKFKVGDFLIAFQPQTHYSKRKQVTNSYGAPRKYVVIHTCRFGVPYIKELNKKGNPVGNLLSPLRFDGGHRMINPSDFEFEVDPDYEDAIILSDEENYDASEAHKIKSKTFKEITEHNKKLKIDWRNNAALLNYLKSLKVGDVVYKSVKSYFTILTLDPIPISHKGTRLIEGVVFGTAQDSKGKIFNIDYLVFKWSAIYSGQPRSYNELKNPK